MRFFFFAATIICGTWSLCSAGVVFQDAFKGNLDPGWSWIRPEPSARRVTGQGLEVRVQPGNMWGGQNNARNIMVRPAPDASLGEVQASVTITNKPTHQYEQVNLVWYYDDSNMVKLGLELVDEELSIVMGREQEDKTRTIAIVPFEPTTVRVRVRVKNNQITGDYQLPGSKTWEKAGTCDLPPSQGKPAMLSLHFYQGPADQEHWARVSDFLVETSAP